MSGRHVLLGAALALLCVVPMFGARQTFLPGPSFIPDSTVKGSSLAGCIRWDRPNGSWKTAI